MLLITQPHTEVNEDGKAQNHPGYWVTVCWYCGRDNLHVVGRPRRECIGAHLTPEEKD